MTKWYRKKLPVGLVLGFTPFSSPYSSFIHKLAASLIYRNNFICKPSPKAINCSYKLFSVIKANCDDQVKNSFYILPLYSDTLARYLLKKGDFDCLLFTGKSSTAHEIKNVIGRKRAVFETGSLAAVYVGKTADIELAAQNIVKGAFSQTGMRCIAAKNVFINEDIFDSFSFVFMEQVKKIKFGSQFDISTDVGPILDKEILEGLVSYINDLKINGYRVIQGGNIVGGSILEQTVLLNEDSAYYSVQEAYGPVLCLHKVQDMYSIPEIYYKKSSLNISIFSNDHKEIQEWISNCRYSGSIFINHGPTQRIDMLPFGGMCDENEGKEGMLELIHVLTKDQVIFDCT